jgi:hypothetical protein
LFVFKELTVLSRTIRICLFDGVSILSNIHEIRASVNLKDEKTWLFENDFADNVSTMDYSELFVRANYSNEKSKLGILFELSMYCREPSTNEETELACGWAHIPFTDPDTGTQIVNKSYDLILSGGSIYEKNIALDPSLARRRNSGPLNEMIVKLFKESKIKFSVKEPAHQFSEILK